jgi:hypothetical protein
MADDTPEKWLKVGRWSISRIPFQGFVLSGATPVFKESFFKGSSPGFIFSKDSFFKDSFPAQKSGGEASVRRWRSRPGPPASGTRSSGAPWAGIARVFLGRSVTILGHW